MSKLPLRAVILATALSLAAATAVARSTELVAPQHTDIGNAKPVTDALVRQAIIAGGQHHGWKPVADAPGVVTLVAATGGHTVTVDVPYDTHGFQVKFKSSTNMNQGGSEDKVTIHPHVNKWLSDLNDDILGAVQAAAMQSN